MTDTLTPLVLRYIAERRRRGEITPITVRGLRHHLFDFSVMWGRRPMDQLSHKAVGRWIEHMTANGLAPSTQSARLSPVRGFARWCVLEGHAAKDWTLAAPRVRRPGALREGVGP